MKTFTIKYPIDILFCVFYSILVFPLILLQTYNILYVIFGIPFLLFIPGYIFFSCISSKDSIKSEYDLIHKIGISIGLSMALVSLDGFILFYTPFGLNLLSIVASLVILNTSCGIITIFRWRKLNSRPGKQFILSINYSIFNSKIDKILIVVLILAIFLTIITAIFISFLPTNQASFTEFYILGASGNTINYPQNLTVGQYSNLTIGLINHEQKKINYTIEIWLINRTVNYNTSKNIIEYTYHEMWFLDKLTVSLNHFSPDKDLIWQPQWEYLYNFNINRTGQYILMFLLFTTPAPDYNKLINYQEFAVTEIQSAYQNLYIWLDIR